jgi:RsiW-degrading membrane proteinase PrsW (M82 family)
VICQRCGTGNFQTATVCAQCGGGLAIAAVSRTPAATGRFDYSLIFPVRQWLADRPWNRPWVRWFAFFAFFPLLCTGLDLRAVRLEQVAWLFAGYFGILWAVLLFQSLRPATSCLRRLLVVVPVSIALVGTFELLLGSWPRLAAARGTLPDSPGMLGLAWQFALVALPEEAIKAFPVWWIVWLRHASEEPREIAYLGAVSGLIFGVAEAVNYSIQYAALRDAGEVTIGAYLTLQMVRWISLPLLHGVWTGIAAYFLAFSAVARGHRWWLLLLAILIPSLLHAIYNASSPGAGAHVMSLGSLALFVCYGRSASIVLAGLRSVP